jgi:ABC-2 type transport system ATP-binding protein
MASPEALLSLHNLTKQYRGTRAAALDNVSLNVYPGEVYGFLGANGAGKSTTIRTLLNFIIPTAGSATIAGHDTVHESVAAKQYVGYLSGEVALYGRASGKDFLHYMAALQPLLHTNRMQELVDRFDVPLHQSIATLSKGNRQKLGLIQAFMHEPTVLILDEPTSGLDPLMQEEFFKLLEESKAHGAAIFLSSHNLAEVQRICDRVGIIKHGRLIRQQVISELSGLGTPALTIRLGTPAQLATLIKESQLKFVAQRDGSTIVVQPKESIASALAVLSKYDIQSLTSEHIDLEDEFLKFYGDDV